MEPDQLASEKPADLPRGYKTFSMLNSAEYKIYLAIVGILTFY